MKTAGFPAEMIATCLKRAFDEVLDAHPEFDPHIEEFAILMGEALTLSPEFSWAGGNIWHDVDVTVINERGLWSDDNSYLIAWLVGVAEKGIDDMPFFPDIVTLRAVVDAIENKQIKVPEQHKEAVAKAILQIKLDFAGQL